jgi:hypothetical protein
MTGSGLVITAVDIEGMRMVTATPLCERHKESVSENVYENSGGAVFAMPTTNHPSEEEQAEYDKKLEEAETVQLKRRLHMRRN